MNPPVSRRAFLLGTAGAAALTVTGCRNGDTRGAFSTAGILDFTNPLRIPPLAASMTAADGTRVFKLTAGAGSSRFLTGRTTPTWGYNGTFLGPTLRARRGEKVRVTVVNALEESTTVHARHAPARRLRRRSPPGHRSRRCVDT